MKEFFKQLMENSKSKINSAFVSSYLISLLLINWKPFSILLFSNYSIEERIDTIDNLYNNLKYDTPLYIALFYSLIIPYIESLFKFLIKFSKEIDFYTIHTITVKKLENEIKIADKEIELFEKKAISEENLNQKKINTSLKKDFDDLKFIVSKFFSSSENIEFNKSYEFFKNNEHFQYFPQIIDLITDGATIDQIHLNPRILGHFSSNGIINAKKMNHGNTSYRNYSFTPKGLYYVWKYYSEKKI